MKAVVQMVHQKVMGSVIDAIEYYLVARLYSKDVYLIFFSFTKDPSHKKYKATILDLIRDRYNYPENGYQDNVVTLNPIELITTKLDSAVIIDYGTIPRIHGFLNTKQVIIVSELTDKPYFLSKKKYNVTYYSEMPFVYVDVPYRMKFAFDFYPELHNVKKALYVNSPENDYEQDIELQQIARSYNKEILLKSFTHKQNLFEQFDSYLYYHANRYFDTHPRLFHECYFYGKEIAYINKHDVKDGSYYRYLDLQKTGLKDRVLDKNDEVIAQLIS